MSTVYRTVLADLGPRIVSGGVAEGSVITLEQLCETYGVSRTIAREVVQVLASMRLVESRRRTGIRILGHDEWDAYDPELIRWRLDGEGRTDQLLSLSELRRGIEPVAASLAATRATPQQHGVLASAVADMVVHAARGDLEAYLVADTVFHRTLLEACGNEMLASLGDVVAEVLAGRTHHHLMPATPNPHAIRLHEQVAIAIRSGDAATAETSMRAIIDEAAEALRQEQES